MFRTSDIVLIAVMVSAAAMTYVAALLTALAQLLRLVLLFGGRGRRND